MASPIANVFEGLTNNVAISAANSGGVSGTAITSVTVSGASTAQGSTAFRRGAMALRMSYASLNAGYCVWNFAPTTTTTRIAIRFYIYIPTGQDSQTQDLVMVRNFASTTAATVGLNSSSRLIVKNAVGATRATATQPIPFDTWVRIEFAMAVGGSSTTGTLAISYYLGDSTTPIQTLYSGVGTEQCGTTAITAIRLGTAATVASVRSIYYEDFAVAELASGFIGPSGARVTVPAPATGAGVMLAPVVEGGAGETIVTAPLLTGTAAATAPAVKGGARVTVPTLTAVASLAAPATKGGARTVAALATGTGQVAAPGATAGARVAAPPTSATAEAHAPAMTAGALVMGAVMEGFGAANAPQLGRRANLDSLVFQVTQRWQPPPPQQARFVADATSLRAVRPPSATLPHRARKRWEAPNA